MRVLVLIAVAFSFLFTSKSYAQPVPDVAWYDVNDGSTLTVAGDLVTELRDKSVKSGVNNNYHLTNSGTNVYHPANGAFPYITFPNFNSQLKKLTGITAVAQPFTIYMVVRQNAFQHNATLAKFTESSGGTSITQWQHVSGSTTLRALIPVAGAPLEGDKRIKISNLYSNSWRLLKFVFSGESSYETVNGGARLLSTLFPKPSGPGPSTFAFNPGTNGLEFIIIGGGGTSGEHANFDFAEMRIFSSITEAEALSVEQQLKTKYGLSAVEGIKGFGDSLTVGLVTTDENTKGWFYLTATEKNKAYYNYGINTTVVFANGNPDPGYNANGFLTTRTLGAYGTNDYCFFMYGTNDRALGINANWKTTYQSYIQQSFIDIGYDKSKLIIVAPPGNVDASTYTAIRNYCNQIASSVGGGLGIRFADLYNHMNSLANPSQYFEIDGIHLNDAGHRKAADFLEFFIDQGPLPVTYTLFNSACTNNAVKLTWKTAQEFNSKQFEIERSSDSRTWQLIGSVNATGISNNERSYTFTDNNPGSDFLYRIVEVGLDNRKTYTTTLRSSCSKTKEEFMAFPNPVKDFTTVSITSGAEAPLELKLFDSKGALIRLYKKQILRGVNQFQVNVSGLAKGTYSLNASWNNLSKTIQVVK